MGDDGDGDGEETETKKKKVTRDLTLVSRHRREFGRALALLSGEIKAYHRVHGNDKEAAINKMRINKFVRVLQENGFHHVIIDDVLKFAVCSGLFVKEGKHDSDIDSSDDEREQQLYEDDEDFVWRMRRIEQNNQLMQSIPMYDESNPQWMKRVGYGRTNDATDQQVEGATTTISAVQSSFWKRMNAKKEK